MSLTIGKQTNRILVVDDVADNIFLVQFLLEDRGYKVSTAENGEAALVLVETEAVKPDLIVLDLMMPGMNGYEVINYLRHCQNLSDIPILLMTADSSISYDRAIDAGADELIYKPLDLEQFLIKVKSFDL